MALPQLNTPTYELEIPSTGVKVNYRPFLVKEQKVLMIASEFKIDSNTIPLYIIGEIVYQDNYYNELYKFEKKRFPNYVQNKRKNFQIRQC